MPDVKLIPGLPAVNADLEIGIGDGFWPPIEEISSADQTTVIGDGTLRRPLHSSGGGPGSQQAFNVAVDHTTDPNGFDVALPIAMADGTYIVGLTLELPTVDDDVDIFVLSRTTTTVRLGASDNFADGTTIMVSIEQKTA